METLGFTPGRQPAPFKGLAQSLAAQADLQDIFIGRLRLPELRGAPGPPCRLSEPHTGRAGSALKAGWLIRGSQTRTDPRGRWVARNPTAHSQKGCCSLLTAGSQIPSWATFFSP